MMLNTWWLEAKYSKILTDKLASKGHSYEFLSLNNDMFEKTRKRRAMTKQKEELPAHRTRRKSKTPSRCTLSIRSPGLV